jgi:hypothetical protein
VKTKYSFLCHQNFDVAIRDSLSAFVAVGTSSDGSILFAKATFGTLCEPNEGEANAALLLAVKC